MQASASRETDWGQVMAASTLVALPVIIFFLIVQGRMSSGLVGGAVTSILFNIPGEPWSVATTFDGNPMAKQGRADEALTAAFTSSFVGALFAVILITFLAPLVAKFALKFGPASKCWRPSPAP